MDLLVLKLGLTPALMAAVSYASRRWGGAVGGLLAGLPLTAAPISIYLTIEQGRPFAALAAMSAIGGLGAVTLSYLVYVEASRRLPVAWTMAAAVAGYVLLALVLQALALPLVAVLALDGVLLASVFARSVDKAERAPPPVRAAWDLPARILTATAMVLFVTLSARVLGPRYSGLIATIPMIGWPLIVFAHSQQGRPEAVAVLLGILKGTFGLIAFYLVVVAMIARVSPLATYAMALTISVAMTAAWLRQRRPAATVLTR